MNRERDASSDERNDDARELEPHELDATSEDANPLDPPASEGETRKFDSHATVEETRELDPDATVAETRPLDPDATVPETREFDPNATVEETRELDPDATVAETRPLDPDATVAETREFDPNATVEETRELDPDATVAETRSLDPDATVAETREFDPNATVEETRELDPDATVAETRPLDPDATVAETREFDPHATVEETRELDPDATVAETRSLDPDATVAETREFDPNATVEETREFDPDATVAETRPLDPDATVAETRNVDPNAITVGDVAGNDATLEDVTPQSEHETTVTDATPSLDETAETLANISAGGTAVMRGGDAAGSREGEGSVLDDVNLGQTINPRALSEAEAKYWSEISAEFTSNREPTALPPAIDRTIVETRLQLRNQSVATYTQSDAESSDYRLVRLLGRGGMGNVFVARQGSLDRLIAVKVIRPLDESKRKRLAQEGKLEQVEQSRRQQFLSEAVVTGDLDHPNIVPIHDVAVTGDSTLFYSMKRVVGTPWSEVIGEKTRDENLEILVKVADAIGFAHTRGVVHRDIKPENVMLGDFGVVMVMDWGIALAKPEFEKLDSITPATGLGGTPSMMAPEMAIGPLEQIGPAADIYLLGATLFMIITGQPPHHAANVSECLRAVASNEIRQFDPKHRGELMNIALKAMSTRPADRYADATKFQDAIRQYRSHAESISLATRAVEDLQAANTNQSYSQFTRAQFGFEEAVALWEGNETARAGLRQAKLDHAEAAYQNGDYDLGLSLLDDTDPEHVPLIERLQEALRRRRQSDSRFALLKKAAGAMLVIILIGGAVAIVVNKRARSLAEKQREIAEEQTQIAEANELQADRNAETARQNAEVARVNAAKAVASAEVARTERDRADASTRLAVIAKAKAEYEAYVSSVGLAKARIDRNEFTEARRLIENLIAGRGDGEIPWELRYLAGLANQSTASVPTLSRVTDISLAGSAADTPALLRLDSGNVAALTFQTTGTPTLSIQHSTPSGSQITRLLDDENVTAIAMRADGKLAAAGCQNGDILLFHPHEFASGADATAPLLASLKGHREPVTSLQIIADTYLVSASTDRTVRVWNISLDSDQPSSATEIKSVETLWHLAPVVDVVAAKTASGFRIAAAVAEKGVGQVAIWNVQTDGPLRAELAGVFEQHQAPVSCLAISPDAELVASGDVAGNVLLWQTSQLKKRDLASLVKRAVQAASLQEPQSRAANPPQNSVLFTRLNSGDDGNSGRAKEPFVAPESTMAHRGAVRGLTFSATGGFLLSCGDDYLIHRWEIQPSPDQQQTSVGLFDRTLRGHGGAVLDAAFITEDGDQVLSVGADQSIRLWVSGDAVAKVDRAQETADTASAFTVVQAAPIHIHDDEILSASLSADGRKVVTASRDRTAKVMLIDPVTLQLRSTVDLRSDEELPAADLRTRLVKLADLEEGSSFRAMSMHVRPAADRLFVGGADAVIRVWSVARGTEVATIAGTGLNQAFAVSSDATVLLTGSSSPKSRSILWQLDPDTDRAKILHRLAGHQESIAAVAISPAADRAITADRAGRIMLWNMPSGTSIGDPLDLLLGTRINDAQFTPDGESIWVAADDQTLSRIDLSSRQIIDRLEHDGFVTSVDLSADGQRAITTSELQKTDSSIHRVTWWQLQRAGQSPATHKTLLRMTTPAGVRTRSGGRPGIASVALDPTGERAVIAVNPPGDQPSRVERWQARGDLPQAEKELVLALPAPLGDVSAAVAASEHELITLHGNSTFRWDTRSRNLEMSYRSHGAISVAAFSPDGEIVASGSRSVKLWDAASGAAIGKLESPHQGLVRCIVFAPDPAALEFYTGGDDGLIRHWSYDRSSAKFSPLATWNDSAGKSPESPDRILSLTLSPDGRELLSTSSRGRVRLHDLASGAARVLFDDESVGEIHAGCFSSDGRFVAAGGRDRLARLWDISKPRAAGDPPDEVFRGHAEAIHDVALIGTAAATDPARSTLRLFTAAEDRSVRVWDARVAQPVSAEEAQAAAGKPVEASGRELLELSRHSGGVMAVDFNADGTLMMTAGRDGNVILWPAPK